MTDPKASRVLLAALAALTLLYVAWFGAQPDRWVALTVFALPPVVLAIARWRGSVRAGFWSGVFALAWFSHGVMVAWTRPAELGFALAEVGLAVLVVVASSWPGLRARFTRRPPL